MFFTVRFALYGFQRSGAGSRLTPGGIYNRIRILLRVTMAARIHLFPFRTE